MPRDAMTSRTAFIHAASLFTRKLQPSYLQSAYPEPRQEVLADRQVASSAALAGPERAADLQAGWTLGPMHLN